MRILHAALAITLAFALAYPVDAHHASMILCIEADGQFRLESDNCDCVTGAESASEARRIERADTAVFDSADADRCGPCVDIPIGLAAADQAVTKVTPKKSAAKAATIAHTHANANDAHASAAFQSNTNPPCPVFPAALRTVSLRL